MPSLLDTATTDCAALAFWIENSEILGLSLASNSLCINVDSTVLSDEECIHSSSALRTILEGPCVIMGGNM